MMRQYQLYRTRRNVLELKKIKKKVRIQLLHDDSTFAMQLSCVQNVRVITFQVTG